MIGTNVKYFDYFVKICFREISVFFVGMSVPPPLVDDPSFYVNNPPPMLPTKASNTSVSMVPQHPPPGPLSLFQHHQVSRIASAPAPDSAYAGLGYQLHGVGQLTALGARNSTSDSQLNVGEDQYAGCVSASTSTSGSPPPMSVAVEESSGCRFGPISPPNRVQRPLVIIIVKKHFF